jgi:hypothetical protein
MKTSILTKIVFRRVPTAAAPSNGVPPVPFPPFPEDEESLKTSILQRTRVVLSSRESSQTFDEIWNRKEPIAVDCEGISLGTKGQLTTIQVLTKLLGLAENNWLEK